MPLNSILLSMESASENPPIIANGIIGAERQHKALHILKEVLCNDLQRAGIKGTKTNHSFSVRKLLKILISCKMLGCQDIPRNISGMINDK